DGIRDYKVTGVQTCALPILMLPRIWFAIVKPDYWDFTLFAMALGGVSWGACLIVKIIRWLFSQERSDFSLLTLILYFGGTILVLAAFAASGVVTGYAVSMLPAILKPSLADFARIYASLAVPALLILLMIGGTFIAGITSRYTGV